MDLRIADVARRIRELRDVLDITAEDMAITTDTTVAEYNDYESGEKDFGFTFLYKCANRFGVDLTELLTGEPSRLSRYSLVRKGEGLPIARRQGFSYQSLGFMFRDRDAEPFLVTAPYKADEQDKPIMLSSHEGQELDYILKGSLKVVLSEQTEVLREGDSVYYSGSQPHGMIATGGEECVFLAIIMKGPKGAAVE